jgi:hypothetical protein
VQDQDDIGAGELPKVEIEEGGHTVGELALAVLKEAGDKGFTSTEILEILRESTLPKLLRTSLSPPLSRLKTKGVIELVGDRWRVVPEKSPSEVPPSDGL